MRTNIVILDTLMHEALKASICKIEKETIEKERKLLITMKKQESMGRLR